MKHIAALAFPFGTHASPLLSLVRRISLSLPDAKFSFFSTEPSNNKLLNGIEESSSIKHYNVDDGLPDDFVFKGNPQEPVEYFLKSALVIFKQAMEDVEMQTRHKITCLITDSFFWFAADIAEEMNVPWIALWTSGPYAIFLHIETEEIREQMGIDGPGERSLDFFPGFSKILAADLPAGIISGCTDSTFSQILYYMGKTLLRATATATNSFEELDPEVVDAVKRKIKNFLNFTKEATIKALEIVLFSDEGEKMRERISERKDLSLKAVDEDGSSRNNFNTLLQIVSSSSSSSSSSTS
ncbi:hypothetical protein ACFE04_008204 [Oxalis oulophora]